MFPTMFQVDKRVHQTSRRSFHHKCSRLQVVRIRQDYLKTMASSATAAAAETPTDSGSDPPSVPPPPNDQVQVHSETEEEEEDSLPSVELSEDEEEEYRVGQGPRAKGKKLPALMLNLDDEVLKVTFKGRQKVITRAVYNSVRSSIEANQNQPTPFFRCMYCIRGIVDILEVDLLEYCFPQTPEDLTTFDWDAVVPGRTKTYPQAKPVPDDDFTLVRVVVSAVKRQNDEEARRLGMPKSGTLSYGMYKQRWREFRGFCAVYRHAFPEMAKKTVLDQMKVDLKFCSSISAIEGKMQDVVQKVLLRCKKAADKERYDAKIEARLRALWDHKKQAAEEEKKAKAAVAKAVADKNALENQVFQGTRSGAVNAKQAALLAMEKETEALKKQAEDAARAAKEAKDREAHVKALALEKKKAEAEQEAAAAKKKKMKRIDVSQLQLAPSPRKIVELDGNAWKPPMRQENGLYAEPGEQWRDQKRRQLKQLVSVATQLKAAEMVELPMSFVNVLELIGAESESVWFENKVFLYLIALTLRLHWWVLLALLCCVVCC
jgi:hypothetical protein